MMTRVATRSTTGLGGALGDGSSEAGGNVGSGIVGVGAMPMIVGSGDGSGISAAPVYVNRPPAMSETPVAVRTAGTIRFRSALLSLPTGSAS